MSGPLPELFERLPEQYFTRIVNAAAAARAQPGPRLIDLGRGNPDLPPPAVALDALRAGLDAAKGMHGYPPFQGLPELAEAIAERYRIDHDVELDPEREVAVVPGTKTGIMFAVLACAGAGDAIALPDPGYPDYLSAVALADARTVALPLDGTAGWQPDFDAVAERPALAVLNYPSNPCAACERPGTFESAVTWAHERGAWLLNDLAYRFLAFDGARARSVLEVPGAREVAIELWSPSKIYGMAGWRVGFAVGNAELVRRVRLLVDHVVAGVPVAIQHGLIAALTGDQGHVDERFEIYRRRREELLSRVPGLPAPEGTFYAWWPLPEGLTAERLLTEHRVAVAPGEGFGSLGAGYVRLSLALSDADLEEGADRLARAVA
jgi:aminotransferase